jgi:hypothetical protein
MADDEIGIDEGRTKKKISKTTWIYLGLAAGALVLTYLIYEHSKGSSGSGSNSNPMGGTPINPAAEVAVPTAASTYQPGTEMQAYQQGINDALSIVQAQQGTGAESSSTTTPSTSSGSGTSSQTQPVTTTPVTAPITAPVTTSTPVTSTTSTYTPPTSYQLVSNDPNYHFSEPFNPPTVSSTPTASSTPTYNYPSIVQTADGSMYVLGQWPNTTSNYQVYGGAPVYFGNATTLAQGPQYEQPGNYIYTPVQYKSDIYGHGIPEP